MDEMSKAAPHFVRCIKPNHEKKPNLFAESMITDQLRYTGALVTACHGLSCVVTACHCTTQSIDAMPCLLLTSNVQACHTLSASVTYATARRRYA